MAAPRIIAAALSVLTVALTGCGSHVIDRVSDESPGVVPTTRPAVLTTATSTTVTTPTASTGTPEVKDTTTTTVVVQTVPIPPDVDAMLDGIDAVLAQLDHLFTDAAASLAAEEGEFIP